MTRAAPGMIASAVAFCAFSAAACSDSTRPFVCNPDQPVAARYDTIQPFFSTDTLHRYGLTVTGSDSVRVQGWLGVVGGLSDSRTDGTSEFLKFSVDAGAATDVSYFVTAAGSVSGGTPGKARVEAFDRSGKSLGTDTTSSTGLKDVSAMFDSIPISAFVVTSDSTGSHFGIGLVTYSPCQ